MNPIIRGFKTIQQVGLLPVLQVGLYRFGLLTGHYRRISESQQKVLTAKKIDWLPPTQSIEQFKDSQSASNQTNAEKSLFERCQTDSEWQMQDFWASNCKYLSRRELIHPISGRIMRLRKCHFRWKISNSSGSRPVWAGFIPWQGLIQPGKFHHWENASWRLIETFLQRNPVNQGPNWMNGQEVALRIFAFVFFHEVFRKDTGMPADWEQTLAQAVAAHARRIPPTLVYARSQQNNHLLVEAAGLYTAGVFLPDYPDAGEWRKTGWEVFHKALDDQIQADGTYTQYSTNYHRLMLQIALWMKAISMRAGDEFPETSTLKLAAATNWLKTLTDPRTGRVPNYGHNDGAYIFPLSGQSF